MKKEKRNRFRFFRIILRLWKDLRDRFAAALNVTEERKTAIYIDLAKSTTLKDITYWMQIFFSAGIATLGLVLNSPAVIIGAMLISPLMGPILSGGLALATGDLILAVRSFVSLLISSLGAITFAMILVAFLPFKEGTSEILSRTSPNTLDLGIAFFSGAIGSLAICKEAKGVVTSIPGVAIAVALMPPLCVVGYGVGLALSLSFTDGWRFASGGGLLYLTNLVAITFTAMIVFIMLRIDTPKVRKTVREWRNTDPESVWWQNAIAKIPSLEHAREIRSMSLRLLMILLPLMLIFIPLTQSYYQLKSQILKKQTENKIQQTAKIVWNEKKYSDQQNGETRILDELRVTAKDDKLEVYLRVFDNQVLTQEERNSFIKELAKRLDRREDSLILQLIEIPTSARDDLQTQTEPTPVPLTIAELQTRYIQNVQNALTGLNLPPPAKTLDFRINNSSDNNTQFALIYLSERDIDVDARALLAASIKQRLNLPDSVVVFERIPTESKKLNFTDKRAVLSEEDITLLNKTGDLLKSYPRLSLNVKLNSNVNDDLLTERQKVIKDYFTQTLLIAENRIAFEKKEEVSNNSDSYNIIFNE